MDKYQTLCTEVDAAIRLGQAQKAVRLLGQLKAARVPRESLLPLATVSRRAGLPFLGLHLLSKVIHPKREQLPASPQELAEYAALLLRAKADSEALRILKRVDTSLVPEAFLYAAFAHFSRWEYLDSLPHLESYLRTPLSSYSRLVGQVNLAFAWIELKRFADAEELLTELIAQTSQGGHGRLQSNCHSLKAQVHLRQRDFQATRAELNLAHNLLGEARTHDQFYIAKWKFILEAIETNSTAPLMEFRKAAIERREWECLREADLLSLQIDFNYERFLHLIFGTPSLAFRARICEDVRNLPDRSFYVLGPKSALRLDLETGVIEGKSNLPRDGKCLQLLNALSADFYCPVRIPGLFFELFPGTHFDLTSSGHRVHQIVLRTRQWLRSENIPMEIDEDGGFFSLKITGDFSLGVPLERRVYEDANPHWLKLKTAFNGSDVFSAQNVRDRLQLSRSSAKRLLHWAMSEGKVIRTGADKATAYCLAPTGKKAA